MGVPNRDPETPIGELIVLNGSAAVFIGYYQSIHIAKQFEPTAIRNMPHGRVARRGAVI